MPEKARALEKLLREAPGANVPGFEDRSRAEISLIESLASAGWSKSECYALLKTLPHAKERRELGHDYCQRTVKAAFNFIGSSPALKRSRAAREVIHKAETMAGAAIILAGKTPPARQRFINTTLRVLAAHLVLATKSATERGKVEYFAYRETVRELAGVKRGPAIKALAYLIEKGWLVELCSPSKRYDREKGRWIFKPGEYRLGEIPGRESRYFQTHPLKAAFRSEFHLGRQKDSLDLMGLNGESSLRPQMKLFSFPFPSHPAFTHYPEIWFSWRVLLETQGLTKAALSRRIQGGSKATAGRHLRALEAAGLAQNIEGRWYADLPDAWAAESPKTLPESKPADTDAPELADRLADILAPKPQPKNIVPFEGSPPPELERATDHAEKIRRQREAIEAEAERDRRYPTSEAEQAGRSAVA
jgi:hypothetical protein